MIVQKKSSFVTYCVFVFYLYFLVSKLFSTTYGEYGFIKEKTNNI